jgi:hypothetical protein
VALDDGLIGNHQMRVPPQLLLFKHVVSGVAIHIFRVPLCRAVVSVSSFFDEL